MLNFSACASACHNYSSNGYRDMVSHEHVCIDGKACAYTLALPGAQRYILLILKP